MKREESHIDKKFRELRGKKEKAFIAFITAGYPSLRITEKLVLGFEKAGVDAVELGVPFSDPMADGAVIQHSSFEALKNNTRLIDILDSVKRLRRKTSLPLLLMTYYNPIFALGEERFIKSAVASGVDGVIVPDLPPDEGKGFILKADKAGLDNICFVSPTTPLKRLRLILKSAKGFIYYVSLTGVTGARRSLPEDLKRNIARVKRHTSIPVCVGFGVSNRAQVKELSAYADGVIIGSAIVSRIKENINSPYLVKRVVNFVRGLKSR